LLGLPERGGALRASLCLRFGDDVRSVRKVFKEEGLEPGPFSVGALCGKYGVTSVRALFAAHDRALATGPGPFSFSAVIETGGLAALGGSVSVTVNPDASVRWQGHMHDSGLDGYHYTVAAVLRASSGRAVAVVHQGSTSGTLSLSGSRDDDWDDTTHSDGLTPLAVADFAAATLSTHIEYTDDLGSFLEAAFIWISESVIGDSLGAGLGAVVFIGLEIGSLISNGSLVPGARLASGILWMAGPSNMLWAIAAEGIVSAGETSRDLSTDEYKWATEQVYRGALPPIDTLLVTDTIGGGHRPFTFPRYDNKTTLNMGSVAPLVFRADDGSLTPAQHPRDNVAAPGETLVHELVHACQIYRSAADLDYLARAAGSKVSAGPGYEYGGPNEDYTSLNIEQQAQIVQDWFVGNRYMSGTNPAQFAFPPMDSTTNPYFHYIQDNLRPGVF
jgi:hypothetical protein